MKYRRLGKTDLAVSVLGIGSYQYGGEWGKIFSPEEVQQILGRGAELGFNLIDTAGCYGDHLAESLIGNAIKDQRKDWIITTKFGHQYLPGFKREQHWDAASVENQLDQSLQSLKTDYIDLYLFHSGTTDQLKNDELWTMLHKKVECGKIRHLGISISRSIPDKSLQVELASELGVNVIEILYNRLDPSAESDCFNACVKQDLGVIARVPLASGLLSGKYHTGVYFPKSDVRSTYKEEDLNDLLQQVEKIRISEIPPMTDMAPWAVAWCLRHPAVHTTVTGFKNIQQLESMVQSLDLISDKHPGAIN